MKNEQVIQEFVNGATKGVNSTKKLRIEGDELINYSTVIAIRKGNKIYLNNNHYSMTTTAHQNRIRKFAYELEELTANELYEMRG